jgi:hypothetical protein
VNLRFPSFIFVPIIALSSHTIADPSSPETIKHSKSECIVEASGGEYPSYVVKRGDKVIYSPESDGIVKVQFSPTGEYIAFSGSEIDWVDIGDEYYSVVILECDSAILRGFEKGYPSGEESISMSWISDKTLKYFDTASEKEIVLEVIPKLKGSFQLSERMPSKK